MNAERLLAYYERIADAPDAIARLRRFILELAVRGKLVPQESHDEPASKLLKRIAAEQARLVKAKEIRAPKISIPIDQDTCPCDLPRSNWAWSRLNEIGRISGGMTPSMSRSDYWDGTVSWLSPKDIKSDEVSDSELKITDLGLKETRLEAYPIGSLFIVARSGILKRTLPVAINRKPAAANQDMKVLVPFISSMDRYLQIMLRGFESFILTELVKTGTTVQSLKYDEFEAQPFPVPPLTEQRRIVAKVDELMALCDRLEAARAEREATRDRLAASTLARLNTPDPATFQADATFALNTIPALTARPDQIKQLRQTILNLAVRGKLVPQDPKDEPVGKLLKRIASEARSKEYEVKATTSPANLPPGWAWINLGALIVHSDAGWSPKTEDHPRQETEWGVLKVSAVSWDKFRAYENKQLLPGTEPRLQAQVKNGDFLISRANTAELVARAVIVAEEPVNLMMSDKIVRLHLSDFCDHHFVLIVNNYADFAREHYIRHASGVSPSMKNISRDVIMTLPFPLPPLAEQHRIVAKVDALIALCDQLEASLDHTATTRRRLLDALLAEALAPAQAHELVAAE